MNRVLAFLFLFVVLLAGDGFSNPANPNNQVSYISRYENVLGTSMEIKITSVSDKQAALAEKAALAEINRLNKILSGYNVNSEFSQWMRTHNKAVPVSKDLFTILNLFDTWRKQSNGALDAAAELISQVWKQSALIQQLPAQEQLAASVALVQQQHWVLDAQKQTATHLTNVPLKLNSFAKSYIIQSAANAAMRVTGINGLIVNIGGDMVVAGTVNETVLVSNPTANTENDAPIDQLQITNKAVATSGNYRRGELINGVWYSHIVDPRTGTPASAIVSATVVAPSATDAGALATAFNVLTVEECKRLAASVKDADYLLITQNGERIESANWKHLQLETPAVIHQSDWKNAINISLELKQQEGFAKRPFAAIWIEDKEGNVVKTLALWYNKPKWLRDLRSWYRKNGSAYTADPAAFASVTGATRSAGKYSFKWDGTDTKGNSVKQDVYTVYIEVVREHGGYDLLKQEMDCSKKAQQFTLKGNAEITEVMVNYGKK
ncbi:thiamine biosynthesis lipoprotein ApbE [Lacibacter cauensis]|uniref:FAD:protein FMN transferase n=2 Tax=Lacibacter cauensis TaxID=510947 RepID=A0A562SK34_9BACT|nr:thiamine biosynthesis lipoprotein ApbE [Lacibacter cauensis]